MRTARLYRVEGRVQGVGFRWYVQRAAQELGLTGYVKNLYDGSVEVLAQGAAAKLAELRAQLEAGPRGARVHRVEEAPAPVSDRKGFQIEF